MRHKILLPSQLNPRHITPHHSDVWHLWWGELVIALVILHVIAFVFWSYLLSKVKETPKSKNRTTAIVREVRSNEWRSYAKDSSLYHYNK